MQSPIWKPARLALLALVCVGGVVVAGKALSGPKIDLVKQKEESLPANVQLADWQPIASKSVEFDKTSTELLAVRQYQYRKGDTTLDVEMRHMITDGNVSRYLFVYSPIRAANSQLQVRNRSGMGDYGVVTHDGRAYLSACINVRGETTITPQQFKQNRYTYDLKPQRVGEWLVGQGALMDQRCLWTLMSVPLPAGKPNDPKASESAYRTLEDAWAAWQPWWQANFPRHVGL